MAKKSIKGQTKKYEGLVKNVQNNQPKGELKQEEPKITLEQVTKAFESFGFSPNERNQNDIGYWTTRPQSEGAKLMEELRNRRKDINDKEEEDNNSKATKQRLSDEEITAFYDEFGLPTPDPEWARNHLPNDPVKIRSLLEMQRKMADDMLKKESKNALNSIPETPKNIPQAPTAPMQMGGMGGPVDMNGGMVDEQPQTNPFFVGDNAIVRITNPNNPNVSTVWLVDVNKKVLRPFISEEAFANAFENPEEAEKSVITLSSKELAPGGALDGFKPLNGKQGVNADGSMDDIEFSPAQVQRRYGKQPDETAENKALSMLDGVMGNIKQ